MDDLQRIDEPLPAWILPPPGGFCSDDLDHLPDLPPHTELIDGGLVFRGGQRSYHSSATSRVTDARGDRVPGSSGPVPHMTVVLSRCDLSGRAWIPPRAASFSGDAPGCPADDVVLAGLWLRSGAGIPYLWLVERGGTGRPTVHLYERDDAAGTYVVTGAHHDHLKLSVPFTIDIDLTEIDDM